MQSDRKGFTLTELAFVLVIIIVFIVLLTPFIRDIRTRARIVSCEETLQQISLGLKLYAKEHQEKFPPNLDKLIKDGYTGNERISSYHYTTGYTISSPSGGVIVFDKAENHKNGRHVLYISGEIKWEGK